VATLIPCLVQLRSEVNEIAPSRDKASDGWIGDAAHAATKSDHNPDSRGYVHAIDVDTDLRESDLTMEKIVQFLLARCRSGAEKRLRYIIYYHRIWSASNGWVQEVYDGPSPHTEHAHFSGSHTPSLEASTASWHLEDIPVAWTAADKAYLETRLDQRAHEDLEDLRAELAKLKAELTETVAFANGGGQHSAVGDAVLNSSYPAEPGGDRQLVWVNLQEMQTCLTGIQGKVDQLLANGPA
jgi:hypothetical protein